jgi:hypothetical protein
LLLLPSLSQRNLSMQPTIRLSGLSLLLALAAAPTRAADRTVTLQPSQDASIFYMPPGPGLPNSAALADGSGPYLWVSVTAEGVVRRALVKFDVSAVPAGSVVKSATLTVRQTRARGEHNVALHRLLAAWSEGPASSSSGAGGATSAGDSTWLHRNFPGSLWTTAGGDFNPTASATQLLTQTTPASFSWTGQLPPGGGVSPGIVADVQLWVNTASANHGWILVGDETTVLNAKRLESRSAGIEADRPTLTVVFDSAPVANGDVPLPPWAIAMLGLTLLTMGWRARA